MKDILKYGAWIVVAAVVLVLGLKLAHMLEGEPQYEYVVPLCGIDSGFVPIIKKDYRPRSTPFERRSKPPVRLPRGVKESDVGGEAGKKIARLGIKAVVLEDIPDKPVTTILSIKADGITLSEIPELKGKWVTETIQFLRQRFGRQAGIICIGPAG